MPSSYSTANNRAIEADFNLNIATAEGHTSKNWKRGVTTWSDLCDRLSKPGRSKGGRGAYVLGELDAPRRSKKTLRSRSALTLDADTARSDLPQHLESLGVAAIVHSTHSHSPETPRYRVVIPLNEPVGPEESRALSVAVMERLGIEQFDKSGSQPERCMFFPTTPEPETFEHHIFNGPALHPSRWLTTTPQQGTAPKEANRQRRRDPFTLPGAVGEFNMRYGDNFADLVADWQLPYEPAEGDRWHLVGAKSVPGMTLTAPGLMTSHHSKDPANGTHTFFDVVHLHRYADQNASTTENTPIHKLPSYTAFLAELEMPEDDFSDLLGPEIPQDPVDGLRLMDDLRKWFGEYLGATDDQLDLFTLWAAHTWFIEHTWSTPRLMVDSLTHGSGKTTAADHLRRVCRGGILAAGITRSAMVRKMAEGPMTLLVDETHRSLDPKREATSSILQVINSGYRSGSYELMSERVSKGSQWEAKQFHTFSPVALFGNTPDLPGDTLDRTIRIVLRPHTGVTDSDWEVIEPELLKIADRLETWSLDPTALETVKQLPELPPEVKARFKECWRPLKRVALAAGGRWPETVDRLASDDIKRRAKQKDAGLIEEKPHILAIRDLAEVWPVGREFVTSAELVDLLRRHAPDRWSYDVRDYGANELTPQRLGRMLNAADLISSRPDKRKPRGFFRREIAEVWESLGIQQSTPSPADDFDVIEFPQSA